MRPYPTLAFLASTRQSAGLVRKHITAITTRGGRPISEARQQALETGPRLSEPLFWEARDLSRILLLPGIMPLVSHVALCECAALFGPSQVDDVAFLKSGALDNLPLGVACRIALQFGLDDPIQLEQPALHVELWSSLGANERGADPGQCPWCLARTYDDTGLLGEPHLPTCLPHNLWGARSRAPYLISSIPEPATPRPRGVARTASESLKRLRQERHMTQAQLASASELHSNYYSRLERGDVPLTETNAGKIAHALGCRTEELFR